MEKQKRFIVVADYPNSIYKVGTIIEKDVQYFNDDFFTKYPHLFRELHWSEFLTEDTIPQYVKHIQSNKVYKVRKFHKFEMKAYDVNGKFMNLKLYQPATHDEYTAYINDKK